MFTETIQRVFTGRRFLGFKMKRLSRAIMVLMAIQLQQANAQDLTLSDTTIATTATFSASSITAGPNFTVASTGDVILNSETTTAIIPKFFIVQGGKLQIVSGAPPVSVNETEDPILPDEFIVHQNFPNPFNPETEIRFALTKNSHVVIKIFNTLGQQIKTLIEAQYAAGFHSVRWDGKDRNSSPVSSGVYLYQIQAGEFSQVRKMSLIR